jgi:hypothetical protein
LENGSTTRRRLLLAALSAAAAAPALELLRAPARGAAGASGSAAATVADASPALARGIALGPGGVGDQQRYPANRRYVAETGCAWVRLWAEWPKLQPSRDRLPDFRELDAEIAAARADGLKVMLTAWRYPRWANGTSALTPEQDAAFELGDRMTPGRDPAGRKQLTFRVPTDMAAFGAWIELLGRRGVDAVEVVNEPNHQLWPQRDVHVAVARMIATARAALDRAGPGAPLLVAPATADRAGTDALETDHLEFARNLLDELDAIGFRADARTAWSHHNYADVESDGGERIAALHDLLAGRWTGWPAADPSAPGILVTESGARLTTISRAEKIVDPATLLSRQAELIARGFERLRTGPEGAGVALVLHYLFVTDFNYDSGLCDLDGRPRPAYYAWAELPSVR